MQMHVIITRLVSSGNLLPLTLGLSSTRHEESLSVLVRKAAKGPLGLKKKREKKKEKEEEEEEEVVEEEIKETKEGFAAGGSKRILPK